MTESVQNMGTSHRIRISRPTIQSCRSLRLQSFP